MKTFFYLIAVLAWASLAISTQAQEATITDPNLSAAILEALQKPAGPLTGQDLLGLTNLSAAGRDVRSLQGLEGAQNLVSLDLRSNELSEVSFENGLTKLRTLDLSFNRRISLDLSPDMTNLTSVELSSDGLTKLTFPAELRNLTSIDLENNLLPTLDLPANLARLDFLGVPENLLTNITLPAGLTIFGRPWDEGRLFALAYAYEQATHHRRPPASTTGL